MKEKQEKKILYDVKSLLNCNNMMLNLCDGLNRFWCYEYLGFLRKPSAELFKTECTWLHSEKNEAILENLYRNIIIIIYL